jgi:hypothetical protein
MKHHGVANAFSISTNHHEWTFSCDDGDRVKRFLQKLRDWVGDFKVVYKRGKKKAVG